MHTEFMFSAVGINHFRICNNNRKHLSLSGFAQVGAAVSGKA